MKLQVVIEKGNAIRCESPGDDDEDVQFSDEDEAWEDEYDDDWDQDDDSDD